MPVTVVGVRHHSPACARRVREVVRALRPVHVLVEGPSDLNNRIDELLLDHRLPVAVFTGYRDDERASASWSPFCAHSPEWLALVEGREVGAQLRFIDLPAWDPVFADVPNRYADAELRYARVVESLSERFAARSVDALWDDLFELDDGPDLGARLDAYFDLLRGDTRADDGDEAREAHMARWVRAAAADAGERHVVVVCGGFHRPALLRLLDADGSQVEVSWPPVPALPDGASGGSFLVPFSFRRLDAFDGYASGLPSPGYYARLWADGPEAAADAVVRAVTGRLRARRQPVSTADLVAARATSLGLAALRGRSVPSRTDVLDGLASALVDEALEQPLPWSGRGRLVAGTHPAVVEMVAALSGDAVGRLHPDTPLPPLVRDTADALAALGLPETGPVELDLADARGREASRALHRLRVLGVQGVQRVDGPVPGGAPVLHETWALSTPPGRFPSLVEAGAHGATLETAAAAVLAAEHPQDADGLVEVLFDAVLCGLGDLTDAVLAEAPRAVAAVPDAAGLGRLLATVLGLWRADRLLGAAGSPALAAVLDAAVRRVLRLVDSVRGGGPAPADEARLAALVALRDAVVHAEPVLSTPRAAVLDVARRCTADDRPPDLRGAAVGLLWALDEQGAADSSEVQQAVRRAGRPDVLGDVLAGLFALAREQVLGDGGAVVGLVDEVLRDVDEPGFLTALPSLRLSFAWFPPRERARIAELLLERRGVRGSGAALLRLSDEPALLARSRQLEARVEELLLRERLLGGAS